MQKAQIRFYLFTVIITLFFGICFTSADFLTIPVTGFRDLLVIAAQWGVVLVAVYCLLLMVAAWRYLFAILFPLLTLICAPLAWFRYTMNATFTPMILDAALENDARTSGDLLSVGLCLFTLATFLVALAFVWFRMRRLETRKPCIPFLAGCLSLLLLTRMDSLRRPVSERIPFIVYETWSRYEAERQLIRANRLDPAKEIHCGAETGLTVVCVLGESLRPDHLGLNGYARNTTPSLSKEDIISFPAIYTEQTYTNRSIPHLLTRADSSDYGRAYTEKSFIHLFNACDFYTVWLANQEAADTYVYFMNECDSLFSVNIEKSPYVFDRWVDGDLLPLFDESLRVDADKRLVLLHTIGSHWWYNSHYTDEFARFQPTVKSKVISSCTREEMVNSYDNTILYTDYFLHALIERLRDKTLSCSINPITARRWARRESGCTPPRHLIHIKRQAFSGCRLLTRRTIRGTMSGRERIA